MAATQIGTQATLVRRSGIAERLVRARETSRWTLGLAARKGGLPLATLWKYENAKSSIPAERLADLCELYGISADALIGCSRNCDATEPSQALRRFLSRLNAIPFQRRERVLGVLSRMLALAQNDDFSEVRHERRP